MNWTVSSSTQHVRVQGLVEESQPWREVGLVRRDDHRRTRIASYASAKSAFTCKPRTRAIDSMNS